MMYLKEKLNIPTPETQLIGCCWFKVNLRNTCLKVALIMLTSFLAICHPEIYYRWITFYLFAVLVLSIYYYLTFNQPYVIILCKMVILYHLHKIKIYMKNWIKRRHNCQVQYVVGKGSIITYYDEFDKKYVIIVGKLRSNDLIIFKDENNQDVTDYIEPYLGPMQNFHGTSFTPADFNFKKLTVFRDGDISLHKTFDEFEPITM